MITEGRPWSCCLGVLVLACIMDSKATTSRVCCVADRAPVEVGFGHYDQVNMVDYDVGERTSRTKPHVTPTNIIQILLDAHLCQRIPSWHIRPHCLQLSHRTLPLCPSGFLRLCSFRQVEGLAAHGSNSWGDADSSADAILEVGGQEYCGHS